jgi:hypothetical protein
VRQTRAVNQLLRMPSTMTTDKAGVELARQGLIRRGIILLSGRRASRAELAGPCVYNKLMVPGGATIPDLHCWFGNRSPTSLVQLWIRGVRYSRLNQSWGASTPITGPYAEAACRQHWARCQLRRLHALHTEGRSLLDTDVEVV